MTTLEGYLAIRGPWGCLELVNHSRTLTYLEHGRKGPIALTACRECRCPAFDPGVTDPADEDHPAPWYDPNNPETADFYGLYGDLSIAAPTGNSSSRSRQRITFSGVALSSCDSGRNVGWQWLRRVLDGSCVGCRDLGLDVFTHCGQGTPGSWAAPNPRPDLTLGFDCCDSAEPAPGLAASEPGAVPLDIGLRTIPRARYVTGSLQALTGGSGDDWPACYGTRVTFSFDIDSPGAFQSPHVVCDLTNPNRAINADACCGCHSLVLKADYPEDCGRCGRDCVCISPSPASAASGACSTPTRYSDPEVEKCRWSRPLIHSRVTCITPSVVYDMAVPIVEITAGNRDVDLMVSIWDAHPGLPDPATCDGEKIYDRRVPLVAPIAVRAPAGTKIILDGRTQTVSQWCAGRISPAPDLGFAVDGGVTRLPVLCCGSRAWIAVDVDCYRPPGPGFRVVTSLAGAAHL